MFNRILLNFFTILIFFTISVCQAKNITLYDQPKSDAKVVGNVDSETGIIPIFTPKEGGWLKVGDPRNGNVGWIKSSDLSSTGNTPTGFTFTEHVISSGKGPNSYQIIQFGNSPQKIDSDQAKAMIQQIQARQQAIQRETQHMMEDMFKNLDKQMMNFPMIMPVIVLPAEKVNTPTTTTKPAVIPVSKTTTPSVKTQTPNSK